MAERNCIVSNSSPLIALERIGRLELLNALLGEVTIPPAVLREVFAEGDAPAWLRVVAPSTRLVGAESPVLGRGEREAIELAVESKARRIILDDLPARRLAASLGIPVIGTAGILLAAKNAGLIVAVGPALDELAAAGFRLSPTVVAVVLDAAGETSAS